MFSEKVADARRRVSEFAQDPNRRRGLVVFACRELATLRELGRKEGIDQGSLQYPTREDIMDDVPIPQFLRRAK